MRRSLAAALAVGLAGCPLDIRISCRQSADCGAGEICAAGVCAPGSVPFGAACQSDADCGAGGCATLFPGGYCVGGCDAQGACPPGGACVTGTCFEACTSPSQCRNGYSCAPASAAPGAPLVCVPQAGALGGGTG